MNLLSNSGFLTYKNSCLIAVRLLYTNNSHANQQQLQEVYLNMDSKTNADEI